MHEEITIEYRLSIFNQISGSVDCTFSGRHFGLCDFKDTSLKKKKKLYVPKDPLYSHQSVLPLNYYGLYIFINIINIIIVARYQDTIATLYFHQPKYYLYISHVCFSTFLNDILSYIIFSYTTLVNCL